MKCPNCDCRVASLWQCSCGLRGCEECILDHLCGGLRRRPGPHDTEILTALCEEVTESDLTSIRADRELHKKMGV